MGRTQLNFRLSEEMKQRWTEHVEESRYDDTISDLVKRAVENQIDRDTGSAPAASGDEPRGEASGEVLDRIQDLQNELQDLQGDVSQAVDAIHGQQGIDPEIPPEIHSVLPLGKENAATVAELVEAGGHTFSEAQARFALQNMARNMGDVKRTPEGMPGANPDTEVRWYRVE